MADSVKGASYDSLEMSSTYLTFSGQYGMVPAGPDGTPAAVVKAHARYQHRVVSFVAKRSGAPPACPPPQDLDANNILIASQIGGIHPLPVAPGGKHGYAMFGVYTYLVVDPIAPDDDLPLGRLPIDPMAPSQGAFPRGSYDNSLVGLKKG